MKNKGLNIFYKRPSRAPKKSKF